MFQHQGVWLPDGEKHFPEWMTKNGEIVDGKGTYQIKKLRAALEHCKDFRVAVDVGGHVGLWAMQLVKSFDFVHVFEPVAVFRNCLHENMADVRFDCYKCYPFALGETTGLVAMKIPELAGGLDTGGTHVGGDGDIEMRPLDEFGFQCVDFLKIDVEGGELGVVRGAEDTIRRNRPTMIVEQKPHKLGPNFGLQGTPAVDLLVSWGATLRKAMGGDFIMSWGE
jgi:FkbM family methyltransferase